MTVSIRALDKKKIDYIEPLWLNLIEHHRRCACRFRGPDLPVIFDNRKQELLKKAIFNPIHIDFATENRRPVGYCVSSVNEEGVGEIDSLIIAADYRHRGIGSELVIRACRWMERRKLTRKIVAVGEGNEEVFEFYRRFNFQPMVFTLVQTCHQTTPLPQPIGLRIQSGGLEELELIRPLWQKLTRYEGDRTPEFKEFLYHRSYSDRKALIIKNASAGQLHLDLVRPDGSSAVVGYCVGTISETRGKIESIYLEPEYRGRGSGRFLLQRGLDWLRGQKVERIFLMTVAGNTRAMRLFSRFNFYCRNTILQQH